MQSVRLKRNQLALLAAAVALKTGQLPESVREVDVSVRVGRGDVLCIYVKDTSGSSEFTLPLDIRAYELDFRR